VTSLRPLKLSQTKMKWRPMDEPRDHGFTNKKNFAWEIERLREERRDEGGRDGRRFGGYGGGGGGGR